jgi:hypothetical protein
MRQCAGTLMMLMALALTCTAVPKAKAEPLVTISCDKPKGFNIAYGTTLKERAEAREKKQPEPPPKLTRPNEDGYLGTPTFVIDSNKKDMTVIWAELPEDVRLRKQAKELNIPQIPPPPATDAIVVLFSQGSYFSHRSGAMVDYELFVFPNTRHSVY